jgi:hypothetical protein
MEKEQKFGAKIYLIIKWLYFRRISKNRQNVKLQNGEKGEAVQKINEIKPAKERFKSLRG